MTKKQNTPPSTHTASSEKTSHTQSGIVQVAQSVSVSGPIPSPDIMRQYNDLLPGAAEKIFAMAERQEQNIHNTTTIALQAEIKVKLRGQLYALIVALAGLSASVALAWMGSHAAAAIVGGSTVLGMVTLFVTGRVFKDNNTNTAD